MDYNKLKRRASYPFETIGVALAFSPRLEAVLAEAKILAESFGAQLLFMHIGDRTRNKEEKLDDIIRRLGINEKKTRIIWHEGNPVTTLLELCKLNIVDLLIVGALRKENRFRFYLGSVARKISRSAKCSVLLLVNPSKAGSKFRKLVVNGIENPKTVHTINTAVYFGKHNRARQITVVTETHQHGLEMNLTGEASGLQKESAGDEMHNVHDTVAQVSQREGIEIAEKAISGKPGFAIRRYAETQKTDLLVINSPDTKYGIIDRIFTHDMEYILEDLPCNVLVVHSRVSGR